MMTTEARKSKLIARGSKALGSVQDAVGQFPVKVDYLSVEGHKKQRRVMKYLSGDTVLFTCPEKIKNTGV